MPLRIIEKEKEGHRKVETDFRKKRQRKELKGFKETYQPDLSKRKLMTGRTGKQFGGRTNLLEEMGRLDSERMNPNRRAEKSRVMGELNRGYKHGGSPEQRRREKRKPKGLGSIGGPRPKRRPWKPQPDWQRKTPGDKLRDRLKDLNKGRLVPDPRRKPGKPKPIDPRSPYVKDRIMTPLHATKRRAKKAIGGAAKIIPKITKRFLKFIKTGKDIDKHGTKINIDKVVKRLKKQGSPGIETYFESTGKHPKAKAKVKSKAAGGRIGLAHGSRPRPYGPHTPGHPGSPRPKGVGVAIKGWGITKK